MTRAAKTFAATRAAALSHTRLARDEARWNLKLRPTAHRGRAFTLIELLIAIGIIVALAGTFAVALGGRGADGPALANAQSIVAGLVGTTRGQAALYQTTARLLIYAQQPPGGDSGKYLRYLQVVRAETDARGATVWVAAGDPVTLPTPICVVPPSPVPATHLNPGVTWNNSIATGSVSIFSPTILTGFNLRGQSGGATQQLFGGSGGGRAYYLEFDATGAVTSNATPNPTKIALTTAVLASNALPRFNSAGAVRGLFIRKTGSVSLVNDATGF